MSTNAAKSYAGRTLSGVGQLAGSIYKNVIGGSAVQATAKFVRRQFWVWPIVAALFLGLTGWFIMSSVEGMLRENQAAEMQTTLDSDVTALREWMRTQTITAELMADSDGLHEAVSELLKIPAGADSEKLLLQAPAQLKIRNILTSEKLGRFRYVGYIVIDADSRVVSSDTDGIMAKVLVGYRKEYFSKVYNGEVRVSKPMKSLVLLPDKDGELRANVPTMFASAPLKDATGKSIAAIGFRFRPEEDFTRILQTARAGKTGETYAFDSNGVMLSNSRFDDDMKEIGLLVDDPSVQSTLTLELRNPGANIVKGERPKSRRKDMPFTKPVQMALSGGAGIDVDGYQDYRGVPNLAAWTWLPEYDFGVVTEVDKDEAYAPMYVLRWAFGVLLGLLVLAAIGIFVAMLVLARKQVQLRQAVLDAKQLGQYTLEDKLGSGGMGTVYRARHAMLRRPTAVKLLNVGQMSETAIARFEREVQLTSTLTHPNTLAIFDYGRTPEGVFYYAMEFLDGQDLDQLVTKYGPIGEGRAIYLLQQLCGSLSEAHKAGLVHRDIKPANAFLTMRGGMYDFVKVLDFGLVKTNDAKEANLTSANVITGTPLYLSPEAIRSPDSVDSRADVYAVGAVAYFLLTGRPPFLANTITDILMKHLNAKPESLATLGVTVSSEFESWIMKCLEKEPFNRSSNAGVLLDELNTMPTAGSWGPKRAEAWWKNPPKPVTDVNREIGPVTVNSEVTQFYSTVKTDVAVPQP
jgi:eukaryotic-like serine/threonine-protein kinase